ncbi:MAG: MATE family efflux transporter [Acidobacteria bacterium]|nr:MATE family efflux transporter [Acidobacteriota bacterium]
MSYIKEVEPTAAAPEIIEPQTQPQTGWLATLREALRGSRQDFTQGDIRRAIILLSVPMILEMMMESLFGIVDAFWVAQLGKEAVAAVGITESMLSLVFTVAMGLSTAVIATVARRIGEKDPAGASSAAMQSIFIAILVSLPISFVGIFFMPNLLRVMHADAAVIAIGAGYGQVILGANVIIMLLFLLNAVFRGSGDAAIAMRVLWIANIINIILVPFLVFGIGPFPKLGVMGSSVATSIGRGTGVLIQLYYLTSGKARVHIKLRQLRFQLDVMVKLLRLSLGGMFQILIATSSWIFLVRIVNEFGAQASAGYTIAIRIIIFSILPSFGMASAAATLVGQNLGAQRPDRAEKSVWMAGHFNFVFMLSISIIYIVFAESLIKLFITDPSVVTYGRDCLRYISFGYAFYAYGMIVVQSFNGAGDTTTPTFINLLCHWLVQIPLAYSLAVLAGLGPRGVFIAIAIAESLVAVVSIVMFRRGQWKTRKV